jgi:hypothetical protein
VKTQIIADQVTASSFTFLAKPEIIGDQAVPPPLQALCWAMHRARMLTGDVKMSSDREPRRTMSIAWCL